MKRIDNEKCYVFADNEIPCTVKYIQSGFNGKFMRIYEDPYEDPSVELVDHCKTCDGTGEVHSHNNVCWCCNGLGVVHPIRPRGKSV